MTKEQLKKAAPLLLLSLAVLLCCGIAVIARNKYLAASGVFWGAVLLFLYLTRRKSPMHQISIDRMGNAQKRLLATVAIGVSLLCTLPMSLSPIWNGERPEHRNQYELLADAILDGHLHIDYADADPRLAEMENPYDTAARNAMGIDCPWDHAYYNGHYYVYFGVVPTFLLFIPYRLITGHSLTTYHATQVFVLFIVLGIFKLFYALAKRFFPKVSFGILLMLSVAFSAISVWYSVGTPALYCTAITAGICMEIWSIYFFVSAAFVETNARRSVWLFFLGSLFGALAFGCRPPIALANLVIIPILIAFLRNRTPAKGLIKDLLFIASPYLVVGLLLMAYNYARFDNPFEFGQAYQLTIADQRLYGDFFLRFRLTRELNGLLENFIAFTPISETFPYISFGGALVNFPILCLSFGIFFEPIQSKLKEHGIGLFTSILFLLPIIITLLDVHWVSSLVERYRMDIYFLMGILCFIVIGFWYCSLPTPKRARFSHMITLFAFLTVCACFLLFLVPNDGNAAEYFSDFTEKFRRILLFAGASQ